jgi:hypothetical protein
MLSETRNNELAAECFSYFEGVEGPFRTYVNPMRNDGVFVGQDRVISPYPGAKDLDGNSIYPAVPQCAKVFHSQLPRDLADSIVKELNP